MPGPVTIHAAKTHLSVLVARAEAGETIVIARGNTPVPKLVPLHPPAPVKRRTFGCLAHLDLVGEEAMEGWSEAEITAWEAGHLGDPLRSPWGSCSTPTPALVWPLQRRRPTPR
ncbi:type II toxin-antitoxin system Phd/YefM family antitoxin [Dankookia sp. P2]|uniref:type II toxin-antitoxin system Phd/YefM family antitoxin n=1 Tax=Dankookia sp. P2 TaxID=3423955 RepID=UPI003D67BF81